MRRLIINADDFGLTPGVNRAVLEGHTHGVITSATLMANAASFDEAALLARTNRSLRVGCHTVLLDGYPVAPPAKVRSLLDDDREFHRNLSTFARLAIRGSFSPGDIETEAAAQFRKIKVAGIAATHFDSHKHAHMFPHVLRPLLRAAQAAGIPAVRNPFAPLKPLAYAHLFRRPRLWTRYAEVKLLRHYAAQFRRAVAEAGLATTDGTFGILVTGALDERLFNAIIGSIPEGTWEFVCHPGYNDAALGSVRTRLRASRESELRVLTSPRAREIIANRGIQLISFADL
ncbi:MAG: ChbG/HpnK family deacetylase [Candidatus Koribacter versatilis]|uniref:ChbG/HpnK family deacetylase n=1 Tax=Candidatus Korobacter versatilis TaxID=658062 RepID=A0A932A7D0_9BACT|nr:ChbG/HpnK family deacetylase [Candidatus Koribacter versatilis]